MSWPSQYIHWGQSHGKTHPQARGEGPRRRLTHQVAGWAGGSGGRPQTPHPQTDSPPTDRLPGKRRRRQPAPGRGLPAATTSRFTEDSRQRSRTRPHAQTPALHAARAGATANARNRQAAEHRLRPGAGSPGHEEATLPRTHAHTGGHGRGRSHAERWHASRATHGPGGSRGPDLLTSGRTSTQTHARVGHNHRRRLAGSVQLFRAENSL